jgi:DNA mismatch endonuclease Vsr
MANPPSLPSSLRVKNCAKIYVSSPARPAIGLVIARGPGQRLYHSAARHSLIMRSKVTATGLAVRRYLHAADFRYRPRPHHIPGHPDPKFPSHRSSLVMQGCFWRGCPHCIDGRRQIVSNTAYSIPKIDIIWSRDKYHRYSLAFPLPNFAFCDRHKG